MKNLFRFTLICAFLCTSIAFTEDKFEKALIVTKFNKYKNIEKLKSESREIFIYKHAGEVIYFTDFVEEGKKIDIKQLTKKNNWQYYDLLYDDVPLQYEIGVQSLARGNFEEAKKYLESSLEKKTKISKLDFSDTYFCKNFLDEKLLLCAIGLQNEEDIQKYYKKIVNNASAHARRRVLVQYIPYLLELAEGSKANSIIDECLKFDLSRSVKLDLQIKRCLSMSLQRKFSQAKSELKKIEMGLLTKDDMKLMPQLQEARVTILVSHEKDYSEGIRLIKKMMDKDPKNLNAINYYSLAECYMNKDNFEEARWNYIQAYLYEFENEERLNKIKGKILAMNEKIPSEKGNDALNNFFKKDKKGLNDIKEE